MKRLMGYLVAVGLTGFSTCLAVAPADKAKADADCKAGLREFAARNLKKAEELSDSALTLDPDNAGAAVLKGAVQIEKRDFPAARAAFEKVDKLSPGNPQIGFNLAELDYVEHRWPEAQKAFEALLGAPFKQAEVESVVRFKLMVAALKQGDRKTFDTHLEIFDKAGQQREVDFSKLALEIETKGLPVEQAEKQWKPLAEKHKDSAVYIDSLIEAHYQKK